MSEEKKILPKMKMMKNSFHTKIYNTDSHHLS